MRIERVTVCRVEVSGQVIVAGGEGDWLTALPCSSNAGQNQQQRKRNESEPFHSAPAFNLCLLASAFSRGCSDPGIFKPRIVRSPLQAELLEVLRLVGFKDRRITNYFDCFRRTSKEAITKKFRAAGRFDSL